MATVVNFIDTTLQAAAARGVNLPTADIQLLPSAPLFKVGADGSITPESITFTATLIDLDAPLTFNATGAPLANVQARSVTVAGAAMTGSSVTVIASATVNGRTYTKPCTITKVQDGVVGSTTYTWIKYADSAAGAGLSDDPTGKAYIGLAYNKTSPIESTIASDYTWSLIKGTDGVPGQPGKDGVQLYTWIKYSDSANGNAPYDVPNANTLYIGIAVNKTTATESSNPGDYVWSRFKGDQGVPGPALYTWIKYADSAAGAGLSDDPTNKAYIGFAYNKTTAVESENPADYAWSLNQGGQGVPGQPGKDGTTYYTWIKYSDVPDGTGLYDVPTSSTMYIGIAVNKVTATESTNKADYTWSKFRGDQGVPGSPGQPGQRGTVDISAGTAGTAWSDSEATAAIAQTGYGTPQMLDVVTLYNQAAGFASTRYWNGSAWIAVSQVINGSLLVKNTVAADKIDTRGLSIKDAAGIVILAAGSALPAAYAPPGTLNSEQSLDALGYGAQFIGRGVRVDGNKLTKTGADGNWNSDARSKEGFVGGAYASAVIDVKCELMFGLTTDPDWNFSYDSIDFAIYTNLTGGIFHYQNGIEKGLIGNYVVGDCLSMQYDGTNIVMMKNGVVLTGVNSSGKWPAAITAPLFFDSSFVTTGTSLSGVRFGAMSSNNFADVGGPTKPQDNATVGAPSGTYVGGTEAGLLASRALNGDAAFNALGDKLSKTAANILSAPITLQTAGAIASGTLTTDGAGNRTGGYGTLMSQYGLVHYTADGQPAVTLGANGVAVKADVSGSTGTFGAVRIGVSLSLKAGSFNADPGIWQGLVDGVPKFSIVAANGAKLIYDPTLANPLQLVNVATATDYIYSVQINTGGSSPIFNLPRRNEQFAGTYIASSNAPNVTSRSWRVTTAGLTAARLAVSADGTQATLYVNANGLANEDGVDFYVYCDFVAGGTTHTGGSLVTCIFT